MRHIFIINPISGTKKSKSLIPIIENYFSDKSQYEIHESQHPGHATEIASRYSIKDEVCLYSVGGDGTAYEVLNGRKDGVMMAVIPAGTGNDYYRTISENMPHLNLKDILIETIEGKVVSVDYGIANEHRFLNSCCMGVDAEVAEYTNEVLKKRKYIPKSGAYLIGALNKMFKIKNMACTITTNQESFSMDAILIAIMNGKYYGGGFTPAYNADIQDECFDAVLVENLPLRRIIPLLPKYFSGKHQGVPEIAYKMLDNFDFKCETVVTYACDGEIFKDNHIIFSMMKKGLQLRVPKGSHLK